ncbi:zinc metalloprotease mde10 [Verticillium dahliae VdLs.17]|uniref:Disintegrin and metalloproteinase domain-containing protein B n=1 Tax=Verticillium dahliae (strain VdLs.17 / ATCC MYA-4575 / FGSC 10137) TaxID=498257 RepID=G2XAF3_VERDV|nr:zinc metalloprotease mde10 [Verticillium dahliae VdLs.17]EGY15892.1 zinc metalloprotease mde10 [Verticillium dahliae VdLs.17]KAH6702217.1 zinc metalloprotease mde10 [Verticillium dahliae]
MVSIRALLASTLSVASLIQDAAAHSAQRNPLTAIHLIDAPSLNTPTKRCQYHSSFDLTFSLDNTQQQIRLALEPNHDILHHDMHVNYLGPDGSLRESQRINRHDHKVFRGASFIRRDGQSEWTKVGWARITMHRDGKDPVFQGAFRIDGDHHHIMTGKNYRRLKHPEDPLPDTDADPDEYMVVWRDSDVMSYYFDPQDLKRDTAGRSSCESQSLTFNAKYDPNAFEDVRMRAVSPASLFGRQIDSGQTGNNGAGQNLVATIGSTQGCPTVRKIALVGIATDCTYTADFNDTQAVRQNIIDLVNSASEVYESSFNISLGIQNLTISDRDCPGSTSDLAPWNVGCNSNLRISDRLNLFSEWRGRSNDANAFWTLLSTCNTNSAVGLAWLGQVCVPGSQTTAGSDGSNETVAAANVVVRTDSEWQVFAHEAGHTFGAVHDCDDQLCASSENQMQRCCPLSANTCNAAARFIMNPSTGRQIQNFSPCSIGNVCSALYRNAVRSECLANNRDVETITGSQCGNGIVESGEECDCGGAESCGNNPCCDAATCRFTTNSQCDPANEDCCTDQCRYASQGSICRESTGLCDPQETCPGDSSVCPSDIHRSDGDSCGADGDNLQCASGQCTSREQQCQAAVGSRDTNNQTTSCDNGCMLSCRSPNVFQTEECRLLNQNYLDGTPCESGGTCRNGVCRDASFTNDVLSWFERHKNILIPVGASVGGLLVLAILWCCISSACKKRRHKKNASKLPPTPPPMNTWNSYGGAWNASNIAPVPPPQRQQQQSPASHSSNNMPLYPGEVHTGHQGQGYANSSYSGQQPYPGQWHPQRSRTMSMRYA